LSAPGIAIAELDPAIHSARLEMTYRFGDAMP